MDNSPPLPTADDPLISRAQLSKQTGPSLGLFLNEDQQDVSNFICHQHRPELIWIPAWMDHPNGVEAITAVTYIAEKPRELAARYVAFFGKEAVQESPLQVTAETGCGLIRIASPDWVAQLFGAVPLPDWKGDTAPHGISITVSTPRFPELESLWARNGVEWSRSPRGTLLIAPEKCGNVILEFELS